jgi:hypothetical protein
MLSSLPRARARQGRSRTGEMNLPRDQHLFLFGPLARCGLARGFPGGFVASWPLGRPRLVLRNVGPVCRNTGLFTCRGLATCSRSGGRTAVSGLGNAAGCMLARRVAAPSRLAPCVRSTVVVTELGYRFPRFRRVSGPLAAEESPVGTEATGAAFRHHGAKETVRPGPQWLRPRFGWAPDAAAVPAEKVGRPASGPAGFGRWLFRRALRSHAVAR